MLCKGHVFFRDFVSSLQPPPAFPYRAGSASVMSDSKLENQYRPWNIVETQQVGFE